MDTTAQPAVSAALNLLWTRFLPQMRERLDLIETVAQSCANGRITYRQTTQARDAAHKLAGSLGTFGLTRASVLGHEIEMMLSNTDLPTPEEADHLLELSAELRELVENR